MVNDEMFGLRMADERVAWISMEGGLRDCRGPMGATWITTLIGPLDFDL